MPSHPRSALYWVRGLRASLCGVDGEMTMNGIGVVTEPRAPEESNQMKTAVWPSTYG